MSAAKLRSMLKADPRYKSFRLVATRAVDPQFETWLEEVISLHKSRSIRTLAGKSSARRIQESGMQDQAYRSRCVEILLHITRNRNHLASALDAIVKYIENEYQAQLSKMGYRTKTSQRAVCNLLVSSAYSKVEHLDSILEMVGLVIEDIDKAAWVVKNAISALEIATKREYAN